LDREATIQSVPSIGPLVLLLCHPLLQSFRRMTKHTGAETTVTLFKLLFVSVSSGTTRDTVVKVGEWLDADLARALEGSKRHRPV
jgi:hypothetical protein